MQQTLAKLEKCRASIRRWQSRSKRANTTLAKLYRQEKRLLKVQSILDLDTRGTDTPKATKPVAGDLGPVELAKMLPNVGTMTEADYKKPKVSDVTNIPVSEFPIADRLDIPGFLRRDGYMTKSPPTETQLKIEADQKAAKKERQAKLAKARKSKRDAKATGATRKMPLSGKEAMAFIRQEK